MQSVSIDFYQEKNPIVSDAYDRLIAKIPLLKKENGYQLFTITGCEPGVGSTSIAISIAVSMANSDWKTLLVDADVRKNVNKKRLGNQSTYGLADCLSGNQSISEVICTTNIDKLHYLSSGTPTEYPITLLNSDRLNQFMDFASQNYDYVIFDSPSLNTTIDAAVLAAKTSGAILVAGYQKTQKTTIKVAMRELAQTGANLIGIVLNNVSKKDYRRHIENYDYFSDGNDNKIVFVKNKNNSKK